MNDPGLGQALHGGHHYENFPVASWLLPKRMRRPVLALYSFARTGDDLADEGTALREDRLEALADLRSGLSLDLQAASTPLSRIGAGLAAALKTHSLSSHSANALLDAFCYDAAFKPFEDWPALQDYCSRSADPVGRLVLGFAGLSDLPTPERAALERNSDAVCSGLQLINFAQDFGQDLHRHRPTLPQSLWPAQWAWNTDQSQLECSAPLSPEQQAGMTRVLARRGLELLDSARDLPSQIRRSRLSGRHRLAMEIAVTIEGGRAVGLQVMTMPLTPWTRSPKLTRLDLLRLVPRSLALWVGLSPGAEA